MRLGGPPRILRNGSKGGGISRPTGAKPPSRTWIKLNKARLYGVTELADLILDDIKGLLDLKKGDPKILNMIKRAAEQGEVISLYERNYVKNLAEQFLNLEYEELVEAPDLIQEPVPEPAANNAAPEPQKKRSRLKSKKVILGIVVLLAVMIAGSSSSISIPSSSAPPSGLTLEADSTSYSSGDIISISGNTLTAGEVTLLITNTADRVIWEEKIQAKFGEIFSTLSIAGGPGWESAGEYKIWVTQGTAAEEFIFDFRG